MLVGNNKYHWLGLTTERNFLPIPLTNQLTNKFITCVRSSE